MTKVNEYGYSRNQVAPLKFDRGRSRALYFPGEDFPDCQSSDFLLLPIYAINLYKTRKLKKNCY